MPNAFIRINHLPSLTPGLCSRGSLESATLCKSDFCKFVTLAALRVSHASFSTLPVRRKDFLHAVISSLHVTPTSASPSAPYTTHSQPSESHTRHSPRLPLPRVRVHVLLPRPRLPPGCTYIASQVPRFHQQLHSHSNLHLHRLILTPHSHSRILFLLYSQRRVPLAVAG